MLAEGAGLGRGGPTGAARDSSLIFLCHDDRWLKGLISVEFVGSTRRRVASLNSDLRSLFKLSRWHVSCTPYEGVLMETSNSDKPVPNSIMKIMKVAVALIVVGIVLWLVNTYVPMAGSIRAILNVVVVVATCVLVLQAVGLWGAVVRLWTDLSHRISG